MISTASAIKLELQTATVVLLSWSCKQQQWTRDSLSHSIICVLQNKLLPPREQTSFYLLVCVLQNKLLPPREHTSYWLILDCALNQIISNSFDNHWKCNDPALRCLYSEFFYSFAIAVCGFSGLGIASISRKPFHNLKFSPSDTELANSVIYWDISCITVWPDRSVTFII